MLQKKIKKKTKIKEKGQKEIENKNHEKKVIKINPSVEFIFIFIGSNDIRFYRKVMSFKMCI